MDEQVEKTKENKELELEIHKAIKNEKIKVFQNNLEQLKGLKDMQNFELVKKMEAIEENKRLQQSQKQKMIELTMTGQ